MDWNVSGVDPALRHRAEEAARHAGASLAVWLSETILSTATISPPSHLPPPLGFKTRPRNGFRRTIRANLAGFLLGVAIIGAALWGFIYVLDEQEAALSPRRGASTYVPPLPATAPDNAAPIPANPQLAALRAAAAEGDPVAQTQLAQRYLDGNGVAADPVMAAQLLEEAAVQGYADGQYRLAMINEEGRGRAKDSAMAFFWYDSAASRGSIPAAARLGILYAEGRGTAKDYMHAATWFRRAAEAGDARAQYALGFLYDRGLGVVADAGEARRWWQQASDKGVAEASARLAGRDAPPPFGIVVSVPGTGEAHAVAPGAADRPLTLAEIAEMQQLLKLLAFDPGSTDGLVTPQTTDAIRAYEGIAGLPTDGHPSMALLASLRAVAGAKAPQ